MQMSSWTRLRLTLVALALAACAKTSGESNGSDTRSGAPERLAPASADQPGRSERIVIKFSDPGNAGPLAFAKREGILERELAKAGAEIEWVPGMGSFSASYEAMNSGAINASGGAVSPVVGALAHGLKFRIFSIGDPSAPRRAGIIAPKGSSIARVEDLKGKRVAVNLAAHGDYVLLRALEKHGIPASEVTRVPIQPPDAAAAFATGKIDAWSTFNVFFTTAVQNGAHVVAYESDLQSDDVTVTAAHADVLARNPRAFQIFIAVVARLTEQARQHPEKFQNVFTSQGPTAVSGARLEADIEDTRRAPVQRVPNAEDAARVGNVVRLLHENRSIDRSIAPSEIILDVDAATAGSAEVR